jgi:hypothetical protein
MRKTFWVLAVVIGIGAGPLLAQFTTAEQAEYEKWEEFLLTAKVVDSEQLPKSEGVTQPYALTLEKDGVRRKALWKNALGERVGGYKETWKGEIAAYRLSRYLGLHMVPPTVEREFQGDRGSCQIWVDHWITMADVREKKLNPPGPKINAFFKALFLHRAFDNLIYNIDRHLRNYLIMEDWRLILIDHSRSFGTAKKACKDLIYDEKYKEGPNFIMAELPRSFVEAMKALTPEVVRTVVGEYLTDQEIACTISRRDLIIAWLDKRIKELGEAKVLY